MDRVRDVLLIGAIVTHYLLVGADAYSQASITPVALSAPPASLAMYQGEYVYNPAPFWRITNTLAIVFLVAALAANWRSTRRTLLLSALVGSIAISIVSLAYIFPGYTALVSSPYSETIDAALLDRGTTWQKIALTRLATFGCLGLLPLWALTRPAS